MNSVTSVHLLTDTPLARGMKSLFMELSGRLGLDGQSRIKVFLAGGMAAHLYTAMRPTSDIDAEFNVRLKVPEGLIAVVDMEDGSAIPLYFDTNYNSSFALMHEDYLDDAILIDMSIPGMDIYVLSPVDLVVSKLSRLSDSDKEDIEAVLNAGLTTANAIEQRATDALIGYIGGSLIKHNIKDVVDLARSIEISRAHGPT